MSNLQVIALLLSFLCILEASGVREEACNFLAQLCKADVTCLDYEVFFDQCMKKNLVWKAAHNNQGVEHTKLAYGLLHPTESEPEISVADDESIVHTKQGRQSKAFSESSKDLNPALAKRLLELYQWESLHEGAINEPKGLNPALTRVDDQLQDSSTEASALSKYSPYFLKHDSVLYKDNAKLLAIKDAVEIINSYVKRDAQLPNTVDAKSDQSLVNEQKRDKRIATNIDSLRGFNVNPKHKDAGGFRVDSEKLADHEEQAIIVRDQLDSVSQQKPIAVQRGLIALSFSNNVTGILLQSIGRVLQSKLWNVDSTSEDIFHVKSHNISVVVYSMLIDPTTFPLADDVNTVAKALNSDPAIRASIKNILGLDLLSAVPVDELSPAPYVPEIVHVKNIRSWDHFAYVTSIISGCTLGLIASAVIVCAIRRKRKATYPINLYKSEAVKDYQELCRSQMSVSGPGAASQNQGTEQDGSTMKHSWNEDPFPYNMDITTGHAVLSYMEDHLKNENRLNKEWEALCSYKADRAEAEAGSDPKNMSKNRYRDVLPYDHSRVKLRETANMFHSDYINASYLMDVDPRNPDYIATQGPLDNTVADFWQMVWEKGVVVIVNLTKLSDMGLQQCSRYWPEDGSSVYYIYEVHLISEHIWCEDYLVRSLYLKNTQTGETRTVTQFHFLTWPDLNVLSGPKPLLEFRRKINKCYRGHACPIVVHCNNGVGRTGTYILIDMVLNKMAKGAKEVDIAATLEHIRDQRADMVKTKAQFEFALAAVAEEVTAILTSMTK